MGILQDLFGATARSSINYLKSKCGVQMIGFAVEKIDSRECFLGDVVWPTTISFNRRKLLIFDSNLAIDYRDQRINGFVPEVSRIASKLLVCFTQESFLPHFVEIVLSSNGDDPCKIASERCNKILEMLEKDGVDGDYSIGRSLIEEIIARKDELSESENHLSNFWIITRAIHREIENSHIASNKYVHKINKLCDELITRQCLFPKLSFMIAAIMYYLHENIDIEPYTSVNKKVKESLGKNNLDLKKERRACNNFARDVSMYYMMAKLEKIRFLNTLPVFISADSIFLILLNEIIYFDESQKGWVPVFNKLSKLQPVLEPLIMVCLDKHLNRRLIGEDVKINNLRNFAEEIIRG